MFEMVSYGLCLQIAKITILCKKDKIVYFLSVESIKLDRKYAPIEYQGSRVATRDVGYIKAVYVIFFSLCHVFYCKQAYPTHPPCTVYGVQDWILNRM